MNYKKLIVGLSLLVPVVCFAQPHSNLQKTHHRQQTIQQATSYTAQNQAKININTASEAVLQSVKGIGPKRAVKIIAYRKKNGDFKSVNDLTNIRGIGSKMIARIQNKLSVK